MADSGLPGFNVVGYVSANLGVGVTGRCVARAVLKRGAPLAVLDLDPGHGQSGHDMSLKRHMVPGPGDLPHPVTILALPPNALALALRQMPELANRSRIVAGFCMWELPAPPALYANDLARLDAVVCESRFIRAAFDFGLPGPATIHTRHPLWMPDGVVSNRGRFGLPENAFVCLTCFDPGSDPARKNPMAALKAFDQALGREPGAIMAVKLNNPVKNGREEPIVKELRDFAGDRPGIMLLPKTLSYPYLLSLYASCDAFISLHRSEGLGLCPMEAMSLGKPVVATGWSGNMSYMDQLNSCPVRYDLVPVKDSRLYGPDRTGMESFWAEPDVDHAASLLRALFDDTAMARDLGRRAAKDMAEYEAKARKARFLDELAVLMARKDAFR